MGREQKDERPGAGALHAVDEPAVLPLREALESERRPEHVASQPLSAFAIVLVDPDPGVKGEALEEGAAADVGERVRIPEPPVHLGGLESGQCLVLGLLLVGGENLGCPPNDATENGLDVLILRRWQGHEASGAVLVEFEDPVRRQSVEMDVEVDGASRALDRGDAAGPRIDHPQAPCAPSLVGEDGAGEHVEQARGERWVARGEEAHLAGKGEDPLAHRDGRQDVADEVVGSILHASGRARGADRCLAGEGDEPLEATVRASDSCETSSQYSTIRVSA